MDQPWGTGTHGGRNRTCFLEGRAEVPVDKECEPLKGDDLNLKHKLEELQHLPPPIGKEEGWCQDAWMAVKFRLGVPRSRS